MFFQKKKLNVSTIIAIVFVATQTKLVNTLNYLPFHHLSYIVFDDFIVVVIVDFGVAGIKVINHKTNLKM